MRGVRLLLLEIEVTNRRHSSSYALMREMYQHAIKVTNNDDTRQVSRASTAGRALCCRLWGWRKNSIPSSRESCDGYVGALIRVSLAPLGGHRDENFGNSVDYRQSKGCRSGKV